MESRKADREVVILMTDMVQYSQKSSGMTPDEIRDFLIEYHEKIYELINQPESQPLEIEPSAGDGSLVIFDKRPGEGRAEVCTRALEAVLRMAYGVSGGELAPTRMGILLGRITEAQLGARRAKFGASFAVANRLEELCGYFGTSLLMDREVARYQKGFDTSVVNIAKVSLTSVLHPMNIFTLYKPGIHNCPKGVDEEKLSAFIRMKNEAMEFFCGNLQIGVIPDFPRVREELLVAQKFFKELTGIEDQGIERILEYIRETPFPAADFDQRGMKLMEKKRDSLGDRLFHLSKELLKSMNPDFYHALVVDTEWESFFKLQWCKKGDIVIEIDSVPDGIYYLDHGVAETFNERGELLSTMESGAIFGEMAYFGSEKRTATLGTRTNLANDILCVDKRTATVRAKTDVVLRKISNDDFENLPVIIRIFEQIAKTRRREIKGDVGRPTDKAISSSTDSE